MAYQTVNPYDNHVVATFDDLTDQQVTQLLAQAQNTFESWNQTSFAERAAVCRRAAAILTETPDVFARLDCSVSQPRASRPGSSSLTRHRQ